MQAGVARANPAVKKALGKGVSRWQLLFCRSQCFLADGNQSLPRKICFVRSPCDSISFKVGMIIPLRSRRSGRGAAFRQEYMRDQSELDHPVSRMENVAGSRGLQRK